MGLKKTYLATAVGALVLSFSVLSLSATTLVLSSDGVEAGGINRNITHRKNMPWHLRNGYAMEVIWAQGANAGPQNQWHCYTKAGEGRHCHRGASWGDN